MSMNPTVPTAFELYFARGGAGPDERQFEEREDLFFHSIELRNGTRKTTRHRRLDDLNALVQKLLPAQRPLEIMDVAVSSGVSTAEWLVELERAGIECNMLAGDAVVDAFLISLGPRLRALVDRTGHLMQLDVGGDAVRMPPPRRRDRMRYLPYTLMMKAATSLFDLSGRARAQTGPQSGAPTQHRLGVTCRPLTLMSPSLSQLPQLRAVEDDILLNTSYTQRFHVLRAANILNLAYFDTATLERMLRNLRSRLLPGGLLIVCRTNEQGLNNATVFTLEEDGRLTATARLNEGSEITDLVLRLPAEASARR
ncbi:MAG TPA: hypothetical protein VH209_04585 [Steroidobacteraceae bacterium]|nr:hypothetical protein [Steroidobacteraceae bacterium]